MRDNLDAGWYLPARTIEDDTWNPYYRDGDGNWVEAQSAGHVAVQFPYEIMWPLVRLGAVSDPISDPS